MSPSFSPRYLRVSCVFPQSGSLFLLLSRAEAFSWHLLEPAVYQRVLAWYIMSCDPASVLETEAREPVDVALMG